MTRINTNVPSITAQKNLARNNTSLNQALTRLSTGLRINSGKDDPAGLIASEELRSDITATNMAISNSERANMVIATADSALGQVSGLLNDIRGLVTEAANEGAMSPDQIAANQLQVDASIQAINRIAATTSFQGRKLLDGSLDFLVTEGTNFANVNALQINQASLGAAGSMDISVEVDTAATQAKISETTSGSTAATADLALTANADLTVTGAKTATAEMGGQSVGMTLGDVTDNFSVWTNTAPTDPIKVKVVGYENGASTAEWDATNGILEVTLDSDDGAATGAITIATTVAALQGGINYKGTTNEAFAAGTFNASGAVGAASGTLYTAALGVVVGTTETDLDAGGITISSPSTGATFNDTEFNFTFAAGGGGGDVVSNVAWNAGTSQWDITIDTDHADYAADAATSRQAGMVDTATLAAAITAQFVGETEEWTAAASATATGTYMFLATDAGANTTADATTDGDSGGSGLGTITFAEASGASGDYSDVSFIIDSSAASSSAVYDAQANTMTLSFQAADDTTAIQAVLDAATFGSGGPTLASQFDYNIHTDSVTLDVSATAATADTFTFTAASGQEGSALNDVTIEFDNTGLAGSAVAAELVGSTVTVTVASDATEVAVSDILTALQNSTSVSDAFDVTLTDGTSNDDLMIWSRDGAITADTGKTGTAALDGDVTFSLSGDMGAEVFSFESGTNASSIVAAVNLNSDATNVTARISDGTIAGETEGDIIFEAVNYGSKSFVQVDVINDSGSFKSSLSATRQEGTDVAAKINGYTATGDGNVASVRTSTLDMSMTLVAETTDDISFTIDGGGSKFQVGPDVVSNQQSVIGIQSINAVNLGNDEVGRLYQLASGGTADLSTDTTTAYQIVDQVITDISTLRGRLGAFQSTTLETNIGTLEDTVENLVAAESQIRDADFAAESAALTRAQVLAQSTTAVLGIANQQPQNVLRLIG